MKELIKATAKKYELEEILSELDSLEKPIQVSIGLLGEFNSGKSTLINAMLGERLLPAMPVPANKSIVEINISESIDSRQLFEKLNGELKPIGQDDFRDIALGKKDGVAVCIAKSNDILKDGFKIIDTPGLASLNDTDKDITFGYLQFLDGAIICLNSDRGNPTDSFYSFLRKDELKGITGNIIFVLTHAANKSPEAIEVIKKSVIEGLQKYSELKLNNLDSKVTSVDSEEALKTKEPQWLADFAESFRSNIIVRKRELTSARTDVILHKLLTRILFILKDKLNNFELNINEFDEKKELITNKQISLKEKIEKEEEKFKKMKNDLESRIGKILKQHSGDLANCEEQKRKEIISEMLGKIQNTVTLSVKTYFDQLSIELDDFSSSFNRMNISLRNIEQLTDIGKMIATAALTAAILPGSSALATAEEAGAGAVIQKGSTEVAKEVAKNTAKEVAKKTTEEVAKKTTTGIFSKSMGVIANIIKTVNPVEHIGDYISSKFKEKDLDSWVMRLTSEISENVVLQIKGIYNVDIIRPIENELNELQNSLELVRKEKTRSIEDQVKQKEDLQNDIKTLNVTLET